MTAPTTISQKPAQAQRTPTSGCFSADSRDRVAEAHRDQRREDVAHHRAVRGERAVVPFRIADPGIERAAHEHLPSAEQQREAEHGEGQPEMREDEPSIHQHSSASRRSSRAIANSALSITLTLPHMPSWPKPQNSWHGIR